MGAVGINEQTVLLCKGMETWAMAYTWIATDQVFYKVQWVLIHSLVFSTETENDKLCERTRIHIDSILLPFTDKSIYSLSINYINRMENWVHLSDGSYILYCNIYKYSGSYSRPIVALSIVVMVYERYQYTDSIYTNTTMKVK